MDVLQAVGVVSAPAEESTSEIVKVLAPLFGKSVAELCGRTQMGIRGHTDQRDMAMYVTVLLAGYGHHADIGRIFGGYSTPTVSLAVTRVKKTHMLRTEAERIARQITEDGMLKDPLFPAKPRAPRNKPAGKGLAEDGSVAKLPKEGGGKTPSRPAPLPIVNIAALIAGDKPDTSQIRPIDYKDAGQPKVFSPLDQVVAYVARLTHDVKPVAQHFGVAVECINTAVRNVSKLVGRNVEFGKKVTGYAQRISQQVRAGAQPGAV